MDKELNANVKIVRLQTGEDIIADCDVDQDKDTLTLSSPMKIYVKRLNNGKSMMIMMPWLPVEVVEENVSLIYASDVLTIMTPKSELVEYYHSLVEKAEIEMQSVLGSEEDEDYSMFDDDEDESIFEETTIEEEAENNKKRYLH